MTPIPSFDLRGWSADMSATLARLKSLAEQGIYACFCTHQVGGFPCGDCVALGELIGAIREVQKLTIKEMR